MSRTVVFSLSLVLAFTVIPLALYFILPDAEPPPGAPTQAEQESVRELVSQSQADLPHVRFRRVRPNQHRVVVLEAQWTGENEPPRADQEAWNREADRIAEVVAEGYLPSGWQVNVALFRGRFLPLGIAGRPSAEDGPEGWIRPGSN